MKTGVILLSLLAAVATWWWINRTPSSGRGRSVLRFHGFVKGLAIGIGVYVVLTLTALVYLALSSR